MSAENAQRSEKLRAEILEFLRAKGVRNYFLAFGDPDTMNWTWSAGDDAPSAVGMATLALDDLRADMVGMRRIGDF